MSASKPKLAVLISGRGSNLEAIYNATKNKTLDAQIVCVISNIASAKGLLFAKKHHLETAVFTQKDYQENYEKEIVSYLNNHQVDWVILAGYMKLVKNDLLKAYPNKILNIHPSLLPAFKGLDAQKQALDYGVKVSGCSVHFVNESIDGGKIIAQTCVEVLETDTVESLSTRILTEEHKLYPQAIQQVLNNHLNLS